MVVEDLNDVVSVRADFSGGEVTPRAFRRNGRDYRVEAVNARWVDREGAHPTHYFSVRVGEETYLISFHTGDMLWRLDRVILPG
jgi:hypothetical protein